MDAGVMSSSTVTRVNGDGSISLLFQDGERMTGGPTELSNLQADLLHSICLNLLCVHPPSAVHLLATCSEFHTILRRCAELARLRCRMHWEASSTSGHELASDGHVLRQCVVRGLDWHAAWASGPILPANKFSMWTVHLQKSIGDQARLYVGVCDAENTCAWGVYPNSGRLFRRTRWADGLIYI